MTLEAAKLAMQRFPYLADAQVVDVAAEIVRFVADEVKAAGDYAVANSGGKLGVPTSAKLPKANVIFCFPEDWFHGPMIATEVGDTGVLIMQFRNGELQKVGVWDWAERTIFVDDASSENGRWAFEYLCFVAFTCALINEPRVVQFSPALSRQQRRALQRGMGFAVDAWTRVSWDLSKETVAKVNSDPSFHKMPLHWCRGHYRRAEQHYAGAIQRPDAFRPEDRDLWWQWIDGVWKGHPAFGVKRSVHAPVMSAGKLASRGMAA